ncbi:flagellar hook-associated protein FlgL [Alicyclobacillus macrosporangiidus]|uniref:Flagellar hook-associated protein 3 FlgL n=1 Tax=Alicyclobacillus macrosporangiidus TaxID=392015 RepID=A0A1I7L664_9BACL|nr:flagellar hook-associated protein FlgL [Alicyclobacillus macrosporangiidus]SFV05217.1 flagellar hook-associated protein 3 FlgL [Alicyclobacillus macrosporangiidus]
MRVTQGMLNQQMLFDLEANTDRLLRLQNQVATGKRINKPADDPVGVGFVMRYKSEIAYYQQYQDNANAAQGWLNYTDTVMSQAYQVVQRARDLAVQGASDTMSPDDRQALASEVDQLYQQLVTIGNSQYNGQYIFNGQQTQQAPYGSTGAETVTTDSGDILYDVGDGIHLTVNTPGNQFFGDASDSDNAFALLKNLSDALKSDDGQAVNQLLGQFDSRLNQMSAAQADVGARLNRVQFEQSRLSDLLNNFQTLLAGVQDADMAKAITDLTTSQSVQQAALQVGARVIVPTLVDFLK